mgnify:CR=1 FL=1
MPYFGNNPSPLLLNTVAQNGKEMTLDADADTSITADTDDQIDIKIGGADDFQFTANTFTAQSGSTIAAQALTATTITASGVLDITDTTDSSDATGDTGALRTEGGASIAKKLFVGTDLDVDGTTNLDVVDIDGALTQDGGAVFNEDSADVDFRVESNDQAYMLFVDAGNNRVGVNAATPLAKLQVEGTTDAELRITRTTATISSSSTDQGAVLHLFNDINFENGYNGGASVGQIIFSSDDDSVGQGIRSKIACTKSSYTHSETLDFYVSPNNTTTDQVSATSNSTSKHMSITGSGQILKPNNPSFAAYEATSDDNVGSSAVRTWDDQIFDVGGDNFSTSTGRYTAPVAGKYFFYAKELSAVASTISSQLRKNGTTYPGQNSYDSSVNGSSGNHVTIYNMSVIDLAAGDYVDVLYGTGTYGGGYGAFGGFLIG